jgi:putative transposase
LDHEISEVHIDRGHIPAGEGVGSGNMFGQRGVDLEGSYLGGSGLSVCVVAPKSFGNQTDAVYKGKTSRKVLMEFPHIRKRYWGWHIWGGGYFVASSGNVTDEVIMEYIESQEKEPQRDDEFKIGT